MINRGFLTFFAVNVLALIILVGILVGRVLAHDHDRPELDGWFNHLASGKGLCCSVADGYVIDDADWESKGGHYRVQIQNKALPGNPMEWVEVPDDAVITEPNKAGHTMVWPIYGYQGATVRCFMPGEMG